MDVTQINLILVIVINNKRKLHLNNKNNLESYKIEEREK